MSDATLIKLMIAMFGVIIVVAVAGIIGHIREAARQRAYRDALARGDWREVDRLMLGTDWEDRGL